MSFYSEQISKISKAVYPNTHLIDHVKQAKSFIDNHFSENITIHRMARSAFYSQFHFIRAFKACYGRTPHQYLKSVRIQHAKYLLKKGAKVHDACYAVGFKSTTAFSGLFKKMIGYTPSAIALKEKQF